MLYDFESEFLKKSRIGNTLPDAVCYNRKNLVKQVDQVQSTTAN